MKKFLAALIVAGSLFVTSTSHASIETYIGEGSATMSEAETLDKAVDRAKLKALRDAQEKAGVYIRSQSRMRDLELVEDDVETITAGIVKIIGTNVKKTVLNDDVIQVFVTVTVQIDTDDLQREIDKFIDKRRAKPPVDRPKPIEQPKPQPAEESKPEKIEQPAEEPAPRGEIKLFEVQVAPPNFNESEKEQLISSAKTKLRNEMAKFVVKHCKARNLNITDEQALAAVDYSYRITNVRYENSHAYWFGGVEVKGLLYIGKLDEWIKNHVA